MKYRLRDLPALARTPLGREQLRNGVYYQAWPVLRRLAEAHRVTLGRQTRVVAVVGSLGKTTTARALLAALTGDADPQVAHNHFSFVAGALLHVRPGDRHAVLEVGIEHPGQMAVYARLLRPDIAVVTSIASEHGRSFGSLEAVTAEKSEMVRALSASGVAVMNGDDARVLGMGNQTRATVVTYGFAGDADVRATDLELDWPHGTRFTLRAGGRIRGVRIGLLGPEMTRAALAAVAVAVTEGLDLDPVLAALERLRPSPLRLEPVCLPSGAYLLRDEFKSTLETVHSALDLLAAIPARRRVVVIGDVSEPPDSQGPIYRELGGRIAAIAERAVVVGGGFQRYAAGATRAGMPREALTNAGSSVLRAVAALRDELGPGDVVLLKGRDTQRLDRVALGLLGGGEVRCNVPACRALTRCERCPMLGRGWNGLRVVI